MHEWSRERTIILAEIKECNQGTKIKVYAWVIKWTVTPAYDIFPTALMSGFFFLFLCVTCTDYFFSNMTSLNDYFIVLTLFEHSLWYRVLPPSHTRHYFTNLYECSKFTRFVKLKQILADNHTFTSDIRLVISINIIP